MLLMNITLKTGDSFTGLDKMVCKSLVLGCTPIRISFRAGGGGGGCGCDGSGGGGGGGGGRGRVGGGREILRLLDKISRSMNGA